MNSVRSVSKWENCLHKSCLLLVSFLWTPTIPGSQTRQKCTNCSIIKSIIPFVQLRAVKSSSLCGNQTRIQQMFSLIESDFTIWIWLNLQNSNQILWEENVIALYCLKILTSNRELLDAFCSQFEIYYLGKFFFFFGIELKRNISA